MNKITLYGRAVRDPEMKYTQAGTAVTSLTLAVDKRLSKAKAEEFKAKGEATADFISVVAWGVLAETLGKFAHKGGRLLLEGRLSTRNYEKDGNKVYVSEVVAETIEIIDFKKDFTEVEGVDTPW